MAVDKFWALALAAFFWTSFCQVFASIYLPLYAFIPSVAYIAAMAIFGLVALGKKTSHLILLYMIGSLLSEAITACSFGWTIHLLELYNCAYYDYYSNCYRDYVTTPLIVNAVFSGISFVTFFLMEFLLYKLRHQMMCEVPAAPTVVAPAPTTGVFFTPQGQQQVQYVQAVQPVVQSQLVPVQQVAVAAPQPSTSWQ